MNIVEVWHFLRAHWKPITAGLSTVGGATKFLAPFARKALRFRAISRLRERIGAELYTNAELAGATSFYVLPDCQSIDPGGGEDFRRVFSTKQNAFSALDSLFDGRSEHRHTILLADSGMGKTSLLLNYYSRHYKKKRQRYRLALIPLGYAKAEDLIAAVKDRSNTVLLLDAFDEDTKAVQNHRTRLAELVNASAGFQHLLITSRTQFFESDDEIPRETGIARFGVVAAGETKEFVFHKIYLSPFTDVQIRSYLKRRFPIWHRRRRTAAFNIASKVPDLTVRPMLLAHVKELLDSGRNIRYSAQVYEAMIAAWLRREAPFVQSVPLRGFSEVLAADIYLKRQERGTERIPFDQALRLASAHAFPLHGWQLRARSLLNRDAEGNLKFSHRTIMEYLFVCWFIDHPLSARKTVWTDQMKKFWWELVLVHATGKEKFADPHILPGLQIWRPDFCDFISSADLSGLDALRLPPGLQLPHTGQQYSAEDLSKLAREECRKNQTYKRWAKEFNTFKLPLRALGETGVDSEHHVWDLMCGICWMASGSSTELTFEDAVKYLQACNQSLSGGYSDWRLPTVFEAISLLPDHPNGWHIDLSTEPFRYFRTWTPTTWTCDTLAGQPICVGLEVDDLTSTPDKAFVRLVRSAV